MTIANGQVIDANDLPDYIGTYTTFRLAANLTTASLVGANATGFAITIAANEIWTFEMRLFCGSGDTDGTKYAITVPAGATLLAQVFGVTSGPTAFAMANLITSGTLTTTAFCTANAQNRMIQIVGTVVNGAAAGTIQLVHAKVTAGTSTISANSSMTARRVG